MAKFTTVGFIAKKKDNPNKRYLKVETDVRLKAGTFLNLQTKPTEDEIANNANLAKIAENWKDWKVANVVLVENDSE